MNCESNKYIYICPAHFLIQQYLQSNDSVDYNLFAKLGAVNLFLKISSGGKA